MAPQKLGRYEILEELGKGAMGVVYLARDPVIGRRLAIKTLHVPLAGDQELELLRARFEQEARSAGNLSHPNIVTIHDVFSGEDGDLFLVMEHIEGTDLKQLMRRRGRLDPRFVAEVVAQIADGLDHAHAKGVVHRDIKPANIILTRDEQPKITDFGIARLGGSELNLTAQGQLLGTPNYISPEMLRGLTVDHRADIFSLGVMLYEMLTGQKPFFGENLTTVAHRIVSEPFTPPEEIVPDLPPGFGRVLDRALAKDPDERYRRAGEMAKELRAVFAAEARFTASGSFLTGGATPGPPPPEGTQFGTAAVPMPPGPPPSSPAAGAPGSGVPQSVAPVAETVPAAAPRRPSPVLWLAGAAVLVLAVAGILLFAMRGGGDGGSPSPAAPDPEEQLRARYLPHVEEGERRLAEGDPRGALAAFDRALAIVPDDREIRELRRQAEAAAGLAGDGDETDADPVERGLAAARQALADRDYQRAIQRAEEVLEIEPRNRDAGELLAEAREGQSRRDQVRDRLREGGPAAAPAAEQERAPAPPPPAAGAKATLEIDFHSEIAEGGVTIYAEQEMIYQERFKFGRKRSGLLRRSEPVSGQLTARRELPSGKVKLRIYVTLKDPAQTKVSEVDADLPPGGSATLKISLSPDRRLQAEL